MNYLFSLLFCLAFFATANGQSYSEAIKKGDEAFNSRQYEDAIDFYFAAAAFLPENKGEVKAKVNTVFKKIETLRDEALKAKKKAEDAYEAQKKATVQKEVAEQAKAEAIAAKKEAELQKEETEKSYKKLQEQLVIINNTNKSLALKLTGFSGDVDSATKAFLLDIQNILTGKAPIIKTVENITTHITITAEQLKIIAGKNAPLIPEFADWMNKICPEYGINSSQAYAHFIAQVCFATNGFTLMRELGNGSRYEGSVSLGNTQPGDGAKFIGRGILMTTGRNNYMQLGIILKADREFFINNPELLQQPEYAVRVACEFWKSRLLIKIARLPDTETDYTINSRGDEIHFDSPLEYITKSLNGTTKGLEQVKKYYESAKSNLNQLNH